MSPVRWSLGSQSKLPNRQSAGLQRFCMHAIGTDNAPRRLPLGKAAFEKARGLLLTLNGCCLLPSCGSWRVSFAVIDVRGVGRLMSYQFDGQVPPGSHLDLLGTGVSIARLRAQSRGASEKAPATRAPICSPELRKYPPAESTSETVRSGPAGSAPRPGNSC